jgi:hypothetical protein
MLIELGLACGRRMPRYFADGRHLSQKGPRANGHCMQAAEGRSPVQSSPSSISRSNVISEIYRK